ncbi:GGDEF domain-containing protein [Blastococcus sp. TF02A-35]|nr:GGDEF domain-containing protein [Blastococcus sp. TF02A_35]
MDGPAETASWVGVAVLGAASVLCRVVPAERLDRVGAGVFIALGGVVLACSLNLLTEDTSAAAQAFLAFPVLWAAAHLRAGAIALVTGVAIAGDCVTLFLMLPAEAAAVDVVFFGAVLVVMALMLVRANRVQDRLVAALREQATVDPLTRLTTRRGFEDALGRTLALSGPGGTALVLIDVDSFKRINDTHGHPVGDEVLAHLAGVLRGKVRAADAVLSRLGGDELAVLMPGCSREVAARRAEELLEAVRAEPLVLPDGTVVPLSISLGVAHAARSSQDRTSLYTAADSALYDAKRAGRGRVSLAPA